MKLFQLKEEFNKLLPFHRTVEHPNHVLQRRLLCATYNHTDIHLHNSKQMSYQIQTVDSILWPAPEFRSHLHI